MITVYDTVCTPCKRKALWREVRHFATLNKIPLRRVDVTKQPKMLVEAWWGTDKIPFPVVTYELEGTKVAKNLEDFLRHQGDL